MLTANNIVCLTQLEVPSWKLRMMMLVIFPNETFSGMQKTAVRNLTMAKRVNGACTKGPAKEQFSPIHKKYLRPKHCEFLKAPRVNPEL